MEKNIEIMFKFRDINNNMVNQLRNIDYPSWDVVWNKNPTAHYFVPQMIPDKKRLLFSWLAPKFEVSDTNYEEMIDIACTYLKGLDCSMNNNLFKELIESYPTEAKEYLYEVYAQYGAFSNFVLKLNDSHLPILSNFIISKFTDKQLRMHGCMCTAKPPSSSPSHSSTLSLDQLKSIPRLGPGIRSLDKLKAIMGEKN